MILSGAGAAAQRGSIPIEGYSAKVNGRVIMVSDVMALVRPIEEQARLKLDGDELREKLSESFDMALKKLIERALILEEFSDKEGEIPAKVIDDQMSQVIAERFGNDRSKLLKALQEEHMSFEDWREQIKDQLIIGVMRRESVHNKVSLSPNAAREKYDQDIAKYTKQAEVKLRMITVGKGTSPEEIAEKEAKIKDARGRVTFGDNFIAVAKDISEGSKSKKGGDWGWIGINDLRPELSEIARNIPTGHVSEIISAGDNYYLLLVEERREERREPFEEVRETLEQELRRIETNRIYNQWTDRLREKHFVKVY